MTEFHSLEEVTNEWEEREKRHNARPLVVRKLIEFYRWVRFHIKHPPRPWKRIKFSWQRATRGWSDQDWWNAHFFLSDVIIGICKQFREEGNGYPAGLTVEEWNKILTKIEEGFAAHRKLSDLDFDSKEEEAELEAKFAEGSKLFIEHYGSLWD